MLKNIGRSTLSALILATWLSAPVAGYCFWNHEERGDKFQMGKVADTKTALRSKYGPFGEVVRATGPIATANPFRFSTKYQDDETDLLYYGYRYYNPSTGRWLSRDSLEESAGLNLYEFVDNEPISTSDVLGMYHFAGLQTFYGINAKGSPIGGTKWGATGGELKVTKLKTKLSGGSSGCKQCCLTEVDTELTIKVYLPNVGDKLVNAIVPFNSYTFTVTPQEQANIRQHEQLHIDAHFSIAGKLCPKMEGDCTGKCEKRSFGRDWTESYCQSWWTKKIDGEVDWIKKRMADAAGTLDDWTKGFNEHTPLTDQFIKNYHDYVNQKLADWGNHKFCD